MPRAHRLAPALAGVVLALAACASPASSPASAPSDAASSLEPSTEPVPSEAALEPGTELTACEIITAADVEAALGLAPGTVEQVESEATPTVLSPGNTKCSYSGDEWGGVSVDLTPEDGVNLYDAARGAYDDASDMVIVGSEGAFYSDGTGRAFIWKGPVTAMLQIGFLVESGADRRAVMQALGEEIIAKLDA